MGRLQDRTAVVFGLDAIGQGIAHRFAREGARLALLDADFAAAEALAGELPGALALAVDPHDASSLVQAVDAAAGHFGGVHVLANNPLPKATVGPLEVQSLDEALDAVKSAAFAMQAVFPHFRDQSWGRIVNVGHRYGETIAEAIAPYNTAAWALVGLTRSAALDWGRWQVATNLLLPFAETPELTAARAERPRVIDLLVGQLPLRRAGDPIEDIGAAAAFLACD